MNKQLWQHFWDDSLAGKDYADVDDDEFDRLFAPWPDCEACQGIGVDLASANECPECRGMGVMWR